MKFRLLRRLHSLEQRCFMLGQRCHSLGKNRLLSDRRGFGMNELLGIAAALILAAFIIIPSLRSFTQAIMDGLGNWWNNTVAKNIFPTT